MKNFNSPLWISFFGKELKSDPNYFPDLKLHGSKSTQALDFNCP